MSYQEDFNAWEEQIVAVPDNEIKLPNQPVDKFTASAETLAVEAKKDTDVFAASGMNVSLIDELTPLAGALRHLQASWTSEFRAKQEAQKEWLEQSPAAYQLRDELLHHFSFAYRNIDDIKKSVMRIREGGGHADLLQDLVDLADLGEKHPEPLTDIGLSLEPLQKARLTSHAMSVLLSASNGAKDQKNQAKLLRDKAYTLLFNKVSEIREYGRYIFWRDAERREKYLID
ncbi:hypothetical protein KDU71_22435 [Carboxylicivirga sediminis]|uniref:Uncharacterized protein n=1 Tax=Carboxylicivirga sediminis TaxID=2006564 RepID=A0A941F7H1_9BACT|nr:hypothetical protein [Carboxylicivirga sediminis]MBR8538346.1 hypothetical protein [Carboxylicivirga sediminis]